jgi:hypothetical protein
MIFTQSLLLIGREIGYLALFIIFLFSVKFYAGILERSLSSIEIYYYCAERSVANVEAMGINEQHVLKE